MSLDVDQIEKPARKLRKLIKGMGSTPTPDDIHKFRTNCRRIETSLEVLSLDSTDKVLRNSKHIAKLRKRAGKIRDLDVLTDYLVAMKHPNSERDCHVRLVEHLGGERRKYLKDFEAVRKQYRGQLRQGLKTIAKKMEKVVSKDGNARTGAHPVSAKLAATALTMISKLKDPQRLHRSNLHPYRLKVKELRNLLQMAAGAEQQEFVDKLGEVKDAIGEWHDWEVLSAMATDVLEHGKGCGLEKEMRRIAESKFAAALTLTNSMRRDFLHLPVRHSRSSKAKTVGVAQPALSATAALAA